MMNSLESLNQQGFLLLNAVPGTSESWIAFATFCAQYTLPVIPLILLGHWFLGVYFPLDMAGAALMAVLTCVVVRPLWAHWGEALTAHCESLSVRLFSWLPARLTP